MGRNVGYGITLDTTIVRSQYLFSEYYTVGISI